MAGMTNRSSLRDSSGVSSMVEDTIVPELDAWAKSPQRGGNVDGEKHAAYIQNVARAIKLGQISEEGVMNLANRIHGLAPFIIPAIGERKQALSGMQQNQEMIGQYINEGQPAQPGMPAQPFIPDDAGAFPESDAQLQNALRSQTGQFGLLEQEATPDTPAVQPKNDYSGLAKAYDMRGDYDTAKKVREAAGRGESFAKIDPKEYTQESVREFSKSGDFAALVPVKGADSPFSKIDPKDYTRDSVRAFSQSGDFASLIPTVDKADRDAKDAARSDISFKQEGQLRDDFTKQAGPFIQVRDSYGRIKESAKNPSAAGDLALVFNYMKMLDPGSTVREGEFATAQNSAGIPDRVRAMYNKSINGERLADTTRKDFLTRSEMLYKRQLQSHKKLEGQFKGLAKKYSLSQERVVPDYTLDDMPADTTSGSLPPGWSVRQK